METNILELIQSCVKRRKIVWTHHVNMRLEGRFIPREHLLSSVGTYEIIEKYPQDKYLPSYLVYAVIKNDIIHIHFAVDQENDNVRIITAYRPALDKWEKDLKTRRKK